MKLNKKDEKFIIDNFFPLEETKVDRIAKYVIRITWIFITFWLIWTLLGS